MGQAFDYDGNVLGEAYGETKREVLDKLEQMHPTAHEIRIKTFEEAVQRAQAKAKAEGGTPDLNLPDVEVVSAKVHEAWWESKRVKGITSRKSETGEELMVPYEQLSEAAKDLDRGSVLAVYAAIREVSGS